MSTAITTGVIGQGIERVDGLDKVTGTARYAFERPVPNHAYAVPVLSTIAHGRVVGVDSAAAEAQPGVLTVLHHGNAPALHSPEGVDQELLILQGPEVAYHGQLIAAVVATTQEAAREAASLVRVDYAQADHDVTLSADRDDLFVPEKANAGIPGRDEAGDVDTALGRAAAVIDATYTTAVEHHHPMEPHATVAVWEHDGLTLYDADQGPWPVSVTLAGLFGLEQTQVRVVAEYIGGGFGSKAAPHPHTVLAALAAKVVDRPVKVALTRQQMFSLVTHRPPSIQRVRLGADADGQLTAIDHEAITHTSTLREYVDQIGASTRVIYPSPNRRVVHRAARLNVPTPGFMRGPGHATGMFALESAMDELAQQLGIDPVELRIRNDTQIEPWSGLPFSSRNLVAALQEGADRFGWADRAPGSRGTVTPGDGRWLHGSGMAGAHHPDYTSGSIAGARATEDGRFQVQIAAADIGTGARTALLQIAADALGVDRDQVDLTIGHSSSGKAAIAGGSMGTASWGWAIAEAGQQLRRQLDQRDGVVPAGGLEVVADSTDDVAERQNMAHHTFGAQFAAVRVDADTGEVRVDRLTGVFAAGQIINVRTARSQFYGGLLWGLSQALLEHSDIDPRFGDFANHDLASYHFAAHADLPALEVHMLAEEDRSPNPIRAKGIGELSMIGVSAAIANALHDATGYRFRNLPITIDEVRRALNGG